MRRPKRPKTPGEPPQWFKDRVTQIELRRQAMRAERESWLPPDGTPAPSPEAAAMDRQMAAMRAATERGHWMSAHRAWMEANGLTCAEDDLSSWYDNPDRDRLPMPGVLQWQTWIAANYSRRSYGDYPAVPLDATAARQNQALQQENQALQQARQHDAGTIARLESLVDQASDEIGEKAARITAQDSRIGRLEDRISEQAAGAREQAALIGQQNKEIAALKGQVQRGEADAARLREQVTAKDAEAKRHREASSGFESEARSLNWAVQHKDSVIASLQAAAAKADGAEHALAAHTQVIAWQEDMIARLNAEKQQLRAEVTRLRGRLRLRARRGPAGRPRQLRAGAGGPVG